MHSAGKKPHAPLQVMQHHRCDSTDACAAQDGWSKTIQPICPLATVLQCCCSMLVTRPVRLKALQAAANSHRWGQACTTDDDGLSAWCTLHRLTHYAQHPQSHSYGLVSPETWSASFLTLRSLSCRPRHHPLRPPHPCPTVNRAAPPLPLHVCAQLHPEAQGAEEGGQFKNPAQLACD